MGTSLPGRNRYIPESTLRSILARFGVSPISIEPMEASKRNDNFLVSGPEGRYVLRRYRRNNDEARVRFQLRFQQHLLMSGFPTSRIVQAQTGDPIVCDESGYWSLSAYVGGSEFDFTNMAQAADAARWLARFHHIASSFDQPEVVIDVNREWCDWWGDGDREIGELASIFKGCGVDDDLAFLRDWWSEAVQRWPAERVEALPRGWTHGDWHGRNMVFLSDEVRGVFDFDPTRWGVTVEDLARAVFMFGRESRASRRTRLDVAQLFIEEYQRLRGLSAEELSAIPFVMVAHWAPTPGYCRMLKRDGEDAAAHLRHDLGLMRDLLPEAKRLQRTLDLL